MPEQSQGRNLNMTQAMPSIDQLTSPTNVQVEAEMMQLRVCQRMVESSARLECSFCLQLHEPGSFYGHLLSEHG